ncbi:MAG: 3-oxoacid CoA-transferase subunit B [Firmicutes bacterium]|jgi:acetate CoA/acetoacetate CoA-transferase beta subunit|nr:3-oxoacid CoA-transferase subunit B [Bacillota bacterium]
MDPREFIARRIASEFQSGNVVNLGIGMPTLVAKYLPPDVEIVLQSENGLVGLGNPPEPGHEDPDITNAGGQPATVRPGGAFFDSAMSFAIIRGGHVDVTVLGGLEVDEKGNLANWAVPGKVFGMGGAMDLVVGAKRVIVAMEHRTKDGRPKILRKCTLPLTACAEVDMIVTEMCVIERKAEGLVLRETAPGVTAAQVQEATEARLVLPPQVRTMQV